MSTLTNSAAECVEPRAVPTDVLKPCAVRASLERRYLLGGFLARRQSLLGLSAGFFALRTKPMTPEVLLASSRALKARATRFICWELLRFLARIAMLTWLSLRCTYRRLKFRLFRSRHFNAASIARATLQLVYVGCLFPGGSYHSFQFQCVAEVSARGHTVGAPWCCM